MKLTPQHIKQCRLKWSFEIRDRIKIYLDTKYWLQLRDEVENSDPEQQKMLGLALHLSDTKKCVFPLSEITFWEILKQTDNNSRSRTFELVDRLSGGFSIIQSDELIHLQSKRFLEICNGNDVEDLDNLIWTKTTLLQLTQDYPVEFHDFISNESFSKWHGRLLQDQFRPFIFKTNTVFLNKQREIPKNIFKSFKKLHLNEIAGTILSKTEMLDAIEPNLGHLLFGEFEKNLIICDLPYFSIYPLLFAAVLWDHKNPFEENDTMDFLHAACALPSCDYFFTENQLSTLIQQKKLDSRFNCQVESSPNKVIQILNTLIELKE